MSWRPFLLAPAAALAVFAACTGSDPDAVPTSPGTSSGAPVDPVDLADANVDPNVAGGDAATETCVGVTTLRHADGGVETCPFECTTTGGVHCTRFYPSGAAIKPELLGDPGVDGKTTFSGDVELSSTDGKITLQAGAGEVFRDASDPLVLKVVNHIGFVLGDIDAQHKMAIWIFDELEIPPNVHVHFTSSANAVGFVVSKNAQISGVIDVRGWNSAHSLCNAANQDLSVGGPGGGTGSYPGSNPVFGGMGVGANTTTAAGAGGGAYGALGGEGGIFRTLAGAPASKAYGSTTLVPLLGGSAGGGGKVVGHASGGGGGGAFQLVVGGNLVIGNGSVVGGINAGGCPGVDTTASVGGGGGSGGAVLVETPLLEMKALAGIAVNGGSAANDMPGSPGDLALGITYGPPADTKTARAGAGGGDGSPGGAKGDNVSSTDGGQQNAAGSGGGSVGRIRVNVRGGGFSPTGSAFFSPNLTTGATTVGALDVH